MKHFHNDKRVNSLMIEINRSLYMNEQNEERLETFNRVKDLIQGLLAMFICS